MKKKCPTVATQKIWQPPDGAPIDTVVAGTTDECSVSHLIDNAVEIMRGAGMRSALVIMIVADLYVTDEEPDVHRLNSRGKIKKCLHLETENADATDAQNNSGNPPVQSDNWGEAPFDPDDYVAPADDPVVYSSATTEPNRVNTELERQFREFIDQIPNAVVVLQVQECFAVTRTTIAKCFAEIKAGIAEHNTESTLSVSVRLAPDEEHVQNLVFRQDGGSTIMGNTALCRQAIEEIFEGDEERQFILINNSLQRGYSRMEIAFMRSRRFIPTIRTLTYLDGFERCQVDCIVQETGKADEIGRYSFELTEDMDTMPPDFSAFLDQMGESERSVLDLCFNLSLLP